MKQVLVSTFVTLVAVSVLAAQPAFPSKVVGANVGFCPNCAPQLSGGAYFAARLVQNDHPTYSYSLVNIDKITVNSLKPLNVQVATSTETGVAQYLFRFSGMDVFGLGTAGLVTDSTNTGLSLGTGGVAYKNVGRGVLLGGYLRVTKQAIAPVGWKAGITIALGSN